MQLPTPSNTGDPFVTVSTRVRTHSPSNSVLSDDDDDAISFLDPENSSRSGQSSRCSWPSSTEETSAIRGSPSPLGSPRRSSVEYWSLPPSRADTMQPMYNRSPSSYSPELDMAALSLTLPPIVNAVTSNESGSALTENSLRQFEHSHSIVPYPVSPTPAEVNFAQFEEPELAKMPGLSPPRAMHELTSPTPPWMRPAVRASAPASVRSTAPSPSPPPASASLVAPNPVTPATECVSPALQAAFRVRAALAEIKRMSLSPSPPLTPINAVYDSSPRPPSLISPPPPSPPTLKGENYSKEMSNYMSLINLLATPSEPLVHSESPVASPAFERPISPEFQAPPSPVYAPATLNFSYCPVSSSQIPSYHTQTYSESSLVAPSPSPPPAGVLAASTYLDARQDFIDHDHDHEQEQETRQEPPVIDIRRRTSVAYTSSEASSNTTSPAPKPALAAGPEPVLGGWEQPMSWGLMSPMAPPSQYKDFYDKRPEPKVESTGDEFTFDVEVVCNYPSLTAKKAPTSTVGVPVSYAPSTQQRQQATTADAMSPAIMPVPEQLPPPLNKARFDATYKSFCINRNLNPNSLSMDNKPVDLYLLHVYVMEEGGETVVTQKMLWPVIAVRLGLVHFHGMYTVPQKSGPDAALYISQVYKEYLAMFDELYINAVRYSRISSLSATASGAGNIPVARAPAVPRPSVRPTAGFARCLPMGNARPWSAGISPAFPSVAGMTVTSTVAEVSTTLPDVDKKTSDHIMQAQAAYAKSLKNMHRQNMSEDEPKSPLQTTGGTDVRPPVVEDVPTLPNLSKSALASGIQTADGNQDTYYWRSMFKEPGFRESTEPNKKLTPPAVNTVHFISHPGTNDVEVNNKERESKKEAELKPVEHKWASAMANGPPRQYGGMKFNPITMKWETLEVGKHCNDTQAQGVEQGRQRAEKQKQHKEDIKRLEEDKLYREEQKQRQLDEDQRQVEACMRPLLERFDSPVSSRSPSPVHRGCFFVRPLQPNFQVCTQPAPSQSSGHGNQRPNPPPRCESVNSALSYVSDKEEERMVLPVPSPPSARPPPVHLPKVTRRQNIALNHQVITTPELPSWQGGGVSLLAPPFGLPKRPGPDARPLPIPGAQKRRVASGNPYPPPYMWNNLQSDAIRGRRMMQGRRYQAPISPSRSRSTSPSVMSTREAALRKEEKMRQERSDSPVTASSRARSRSRSSSSSRSRRSHSRSRTASPRPPLPPLINCVYTRPIIPLERTPVVVPSGNTLIANLDENVKGKGRAVKKAMEVGSPVEWSLFPSSGRGEGTALGGVQSIRSEAKVQIEKTRANVQTKWNAMDWGTGWGTDTTKRGTGGWGAPTSFDVWGSPTIVKNETKKPASTTTPTGHTSPKNQPTSTQSKSTISPFISGFASPPIPSKTPDSWGVPLSGPATCAQASNNMRWPVPPSRDTRPAEDAIWSRCTRRNPQRESNEQLGVPASAPPVSSFPARNSYNPSRYYQDGLFGVCTPPSATSSNSRSTRTRSPTTSPFRQPPILVEQNAERSVRVEQAPAQQNGYVNYSVSSWGMPSTPPAIFNGSYTPAYPGPPLRPISPRLNTPPLWHRPTGVCSPRSYTPIMGGPYTTSNNPWYYPPYSSRPTYGAPVNNPYVYNPSGPLYNQGYNAPAYNPPLYNGSPYIPPIYGGPIYNPPNPVLSPWATPAPPVFPIGDRFWFADGNVTFDVEGKKYHVHKYFFEQRSSFFRSLLVQYDDTYNEPIVLHGTSSEDFERLLAVFYPKSFLTPDLTTVDEWKSVLKLATEWGLSDIRSLAIEKLAPIASAVDQVVIGHAYDIPSWLAPAYKALVEREVPFTVEEGKMLGIEKLLNIMQAKQELYHMIPKEEMPTWQVERRIRSLFALDGAVLGPAYVPSTNQPTEI